MKRCPECRRDYHDDTLMYCLADGSELVYGLSDEPATAILPDVVSANEAAMRAQIHTTEQTEASLSVAREGQKAKGFDKRLLLIPLVLAVIVLGAFFGYRYFAPTNQINSIAVMPFVNASGDPEIEFLSDGITETLISKLSELSNLDVKPRSAVFRYKGSDPAPQSVGRDLKVRAVLNGRLTHRGQDISIYAELTDVDLNKAIWSDTYNYKQSDVIALQNQIARDVSKRLKSKLSPREEAAVTKLATSNPEAYALYLKGNFFRGKATEEGYKKAIEFYRQALDLDPNYALAYSGIGGAYIVASEWYLPPNDAMPLAKANLQKALDLDKHLAEAHFALGSLNASYDRDWGAAEYEFAQAKEIDNNYDFDPLYLSALGRHNEAIQVLQAKIQRNPMSPNSNDLLAGIFLFAGRYDDAIAQGRKTLEIDPGFWAPYGNIGRAYVAKKEYAKAITALEKAGELASNPEILGYLGYAYAAVGRKPDAEQLLHRLKEMSAKTYVSPYPTAIIYAGLGDNDRAFEFLDQAIAARSYAVVLLNVEPMLGSLREDPRFAERVRRIRIPN